MLPCLAPLTEIVFTACRLKCHRSGLTKIPRFVLFTLAPSLKSQQTRKWLNLNQLLIIYTSRNRYGLMARRCTHGTAAGLLIYLAILIGAVGVGFLHAGDEVIILGQGKTQALAEWDKPVHFGTGKWEVVDDAAHQAIKLRTESSSFALEKSVTVDLKQTPYLEWEWKVTVPPAGGDFSSPDRDDQAAQLLVVFPKTFFERRKIISYIWDPTAPRGTFGAAAGPIYLNVKAIVVESGAGQISTWVTERRNVVDDFRALFGDIPERAVAIRMQINSQHTKSVAEVFWRTIRFTSE